ncbi:ABC transporter ATP-binding protein [Streptomyces sp. NPDC086080]|uniref:ABC transporter ATP-binding protein n=1 Tax=Streptomyces sp. NPDC086080 TaxID=3365748 RepID=UPI0037D89E7D
MTAQTSAGSRSAPTPPVLDVDAVHVAYGQGTRALTGLSLYVEEGEVVALLGANGAGKTSLVRAVTGGLGFYGGRITSGTIRVDGQAVAPDTATMVRRGVSQVMEGRRIFADLTVGENLLAGGHACPSRQELTRRYREVIARFPALERREKTSAGYLSGGEQQMLAIGRALMQAPRFLLLDEPSLGLAPVVVGQVRDLVLELNASGTTILLIEQNVAMALDVSARAYVVERGRVVRDGTSSELAEDDAIRRAYLGIGEIAA